MHPNDFRVGQRVRFTYRPAKIPAEYGEVVAIDHARGLVTVAWELSGEMAYPFGDALLRRISPAREVCHRG